MNLKHHLLIRIVFIALVGLITTAAIVLYQENQQAQQQALLTVESIDKQLEMQLFRIDAGFGQAERFPDFDLWKQTSNANGLCVQFMDVNGRQQRSVCKGENMTAAVVPRWFKGFYQWVFNPHFKIVRSVAFKGIVKGSVTVTPSNTLAIAEAWQSFKSLMALSVSTTLALCLMITLSIHRALAPAQVIVNGLQKIRCGELSFRLPTFELQEWQHTGEAINQLVASQEQLLLERKKLALQLMTVQEEERRYLARELHDEFGQCLAAINALSASISQTAELSCPAIVPESENISRISNHILVLLRELLLRLRPTAIDELGLAISLKSLINDWNARSIGKTIFTLDLQGAIESLPEPLPITLFRIVQECLTNIAKHAAAGQVVVTLVISNQITLTITDNGSAKQLPFTNPSGIGLLGIRERLDALGGQLVLDIVKPSGLMVQASLPLHSQATVAA
ncbi:MAG: sensor histidine kinase [Methylococcaceae bacterium]|nr:sensor histidine kinase [Methylococcaceae bacterium]